MNFDVYLYVKLIYFNDDILYYILFGGIEQYQKNMKRKILFFCV